MKDLNDNGIDGVFGKGTDGKDEGKKDDLFHKQDDEEDAAGEGAVLHPKPRMPNLEGKMRETAAPTDPDDSITGGYTPEEYQATLNKFREARKARLEKGNNPEEYWSDTERNMARAMGIEPNRVTALVYKVLGSVGINMYKRDAKKAVGRLKRLVDNTQIEVDRFQSKLEGKVDYYAKIGTQPEKAVEARKYVREADKGLKYRLAEATDDARMRGYPYRNGIRALKAYRIEIAELDEDIKKLETEGNDPTTVAKVSALTAKRETLLAEKGALEGAQSEYAAELEYYEGKIDRIGAKITLYEAIVSKGNRKIQQVESAIDILDDYIREGDDLISVKDLLDKLRDLDAAHGRVKVAIEEGDHVVERKFKEIEYRATATDTDYSTRPLTQQVQQANKQAQVATEKDMGRILGKLGIPI